MIMVWSLDLVFILGFSLIHTFNILSKVKAREGELPAAFTSTIKCVKSIV